MILISMDFRFLDTEPIVSMTTNGFTVIWHTAEMHNPDIAKNY